MAKKPFFRALFPKSREASQETPPPEGRTEDQVIDALRHEHATNRGKAKETLEMIKLTLQDHEGRRQHHWGVLYRSIFAIVTVMAIPYFLSRDGGANEPKIYLIGFPILSFLLCVISCFVQGDLNKRQQDVLADMRILVRSLSDNYRSNHFPPEGPYHRTFLSVRQWVFLTYIILALLSVVELILILMKKF